MVINKVCHMPITIILAIVLSTSKTFLSITCSTRMQKLLWSFSKVKNYIKCC
jgi:hypothetical protein